MAVHFCHRRASTKKFEVEKNVKVPYYTTMVPTSFPPSVYNRLQHHNIAPTAPQPIQRSSSNGYLRVFPPQCQNSTIVETFSPPTVNVPNNSAGALMAKPKNDDNIVPSTTHPTYVCI